MGSSKPALVCGPWCAAFVVLLAVSGCYTTMTVIEEEPFMAKELVPHTVIKDVPVVKKGNVPIVKLCPAVIPEAAKTMAILPFAVPPGLESLGTDIADDLRFRLNKDPRSGGRYSIFDKGDSTELQPSEMALLINKQGLSWKKGKKPTYAIKSGKVADVVVTGSVVTVSDSSLSLELLVLNGKEGTILETRSVSGDLQEVMAALPDFFFEHEETVGFEEQNVTVMEKQEVVEYETKDVQKFKMVKKEKEVFSAGKTGKVLLVIIGGAILITFAIVESMGDGDTDWAIDSDD
jgi:hypothetical protein